MPYQPIHEYAADPALHPDLVGLGWLVGSWTGNGHRQLPGTHSVEIGQQIDFATNGGPYLHYLSQSWTLDADGRPEAALTMETGFWRPQRDGSVEVVLAAPEGWAEVWFGKLQVSRLELVTDAVARTQTAQVPISGGHRLYGLVDGELWYSHDRATEDHAMQPYMWAHLVRTP